MYDNGAQVSIISLNEVERLHLTQRIRPSTLLLDSDGSAGQFRVLGELQTSVMVAAVRVGDEQRGLFTVDLPPLNLVVVAESFSTCAMIFGMDAAAAWQAHVPVAETGPTSVDLPSRRLRIPLAPRSQWLDPRRSKLARVGDSLIASLSRAAPDAELRQQERSIAAVQVTANRLLAENPAAPALLIGCDGRATAAATMIADRCDPIEAAEARIKAIAALHTSAAAAAKELCVAAVSRADQSSEPPAETIKQKLEAIFAQTSEENRDEAAEAALDAAAALVQPLVDQLAKLAADREAGHTPSALSGSSLLGDGVWVLEPGEVRELIVTLRKLAQLFPDPAVVARRADARPAPFAVHFEFSRNPNDVPPTREGDRRRIPPAALAALHAQIRSMLRVGMCEAAGSEAWRHAVVMVRKKDGSWRVAIDFRPLNAITDDDDFPLPDADAVCREIAAQGRIFASLDLTKAFLQLSIPEELRRFTGFVVPGLGVFQWRVMCLGLRRATAAFQRNVEAVLAPLLWRGVIAYVDDVFVYADSAAELARLVRRVVDLLQVHDLRVNAAKCRLFVDEVAVLGRIVRHGEVAVDPRHVQILRDFPRPATVVELRRFIGLANYLAAFVPTYAVAIAPLQALLLATVGGESRQHDRRLLGWTPATSDAFDRVRCLLTSPQCRVVPSPSSTSQLSAANLRIESDGATRCGLGGVLLWRSSDQQPFRLVQACARSLRTGRERAFSAIEVEAAGVVYVLRQAQWLLAKATGVSIVVDHRALIFIASMATSTNVRLRRYAADLVEANARVEYRPGVSNPAADALSRAVPPGTSLQAIYNDKELQQRLLDLANRWESMVTAAVVARHPSPLASADFDSLAIVRQLRGLQDASFDISYEDFPWAFDRSPPNSRTSSIPDLDFARLHASVYVQLHAEVGRVLARDALRFVWVPAALLCVAADVFARSCWTHRTTLFWNRGTACWSRRWPHQVVEVLLVFSRGNVDELLRGGSVASARATSLVVEERREPARKPQQMRTCIEQLCKPSTRRLELFGRQAASGWTVLGDETDKFDVAPVRTRRAATSQLPSPSPREPPVIPSPPVHPTDDLQHARSVADRLGGWQSLAPLLIWHDDAVVRLVAEARLPSGVPPLPVQEVSPEVRARRYVRAQVAQLLGEDIVVQLHELKLDDVQEYQRRLIDLPHLGGAPMLLARDLQAPESFRWLPMQEAAATQSPLLVPTVLVGPDRDLLLPARSMLARLLMDHLHHSASHPGVRRLVALSRQTGYHLVFGVTEIATQSVEKCELCSVAKGDAATAWRPSAAATPPQLRASRFRDVVSIDFVGPFRCADGKRRPVVSLIDDATRWPEAQVVDDESEDTAARALVRFVCRWGPPRALHSDRGSAFVSNVVSKAARLLGWRRLLSTPYHSASLGKEERQHKTLERLIAVIVHDRQLALHDWVDAVDLALLQMRACVSVATGMSPAFMVTGQEMYAIDGITVSPARKQLHEAGLLRAADRAVGDEAALETPAARRSFADRRLRQFDAIYEQAWKRGARYLETRLRAAGLTKEQLDSASPSFPEISCGDYVRVQQVPQPIDNAKLSVWRWTPDLWRVHSRLAHGSFLLTRAEDPLEWRTAYGGNIKRFQPDDDKRAYYEQLFTATMEQKRRIAAERRLVTRGAVRWSLLSDDDDDEEEQEGGEEKEEYYEVRRILDERVVHRRRQLRVLWQDGTSCWLPRESLAADVPAMVAEFDSRVGSRAQVRARRSKKGGA